MKGDKEMMIGLLAIAATTTAWTPAFHHRVSSTGIQRSTMPLTLRTALPTPPEVERPSPDVLVSSLSDDKQKLAVALIAVSLLGGTVEFVNLLDGLRSLNEGFFDFWALSWPVGIGAIFTAAGVTHFTNKNDYTPIVPPKGTWGFFDLPYLDNPGKTGAVKLL